MYGLGLEQTYWICFYLDGFVIIKTNRNLYRLKKYSHLVIEDLPHDHKDQVVLLVITLDLTAVVAHWENLVFSEPKDIADILDLRWETQIKGVLNDQFAHRIVNLLAMENMSSLLLCQRTDLVRMCQNHNRVQI